MLDIRLPKPTRRMTDCRRAFALETEDAFRAFSKAVFADRALDRSTKQLIDVAVAYVSQCPIEGHVEAARREGANSEQIIEAVWLAAEMRAGAAYAHSIKRWSRWKVERGDRGTSFRTSLPSAGGARAMAEAG